MRLYALNAVGIALVLALLAHAPAFVREGALIAVGGFWVHRTSPEKPSLAEGRGFACRKRSRDRAVPATDLPVALVDGPDEGASRNVVSLAYVQDAPAPHEPRADVKETTTPLLTLSARSPIHAGGAAGFSAAWSAPEGSPMTIAHPFYSGGKTDVNYTLFVRDENSGRTYQLEDHTPQMCGTRNSLGDEDFLALDSSRESTEVTPRTDVGADLMQTRLLARGRYTVWLGYAFCGSYLRTHDRRLPPRTFLGEVASNAVTVEVL